MKRRAWWLFAAALGTLALLHLFGPPALQAGPVFSVFGLSSIAAVVAGVRMHRPGVRAPWYIVAAGLALFATGDILTYNYARLFGNEPPFPSVADAFYLAVYPAIVAGLLILIRRRNPGRDWASLIDSLIVATGLALVSWIFLIAPYARDARLDPLERIVSMAYPLMDALLLIVTVRLAVGRGARGASYGFMVLSIAALLTTDSLYGWKLLHGGYEPGGLLDVGWIGFYLLWGAAALHPSMARVSEATEHLPTLTWRRLAVLGTAASLAPAVQLIQSVRDGPGGSLVVPIGAITLFTLVIGRMAVLVRAQEAAARHERTLREAGSALVTATSPLDIVVAAEAVARTIAGPGSTAAVFRLEPIDGVATLVRWGAGTDPTTAVRRPLSSLPPRAVECLERLVPTDVPAARLLGPGHSGRAFTAPLVSRGELAAVLLVAPEHGRLAVRTCSVLESLAFQVALALESAELTEHLVRVEGEARFSSLVQHSSDVIFVLAGDLTIRYVSPAVTGILGFAAEELAATSFADLIDLDDRPLALGAIGALKVRAREPAEVLEFRVRQRDGDVLVAEALVTNLLETPAVEGIVVNLRDITERKRFEHQLTYQAFHDPVTGLANRALFRDRIEHALERRRSDNGTIALLFLDLDDFKVVNDTFGHLAGDSLLQLVGARVSEALRSGDTAARLGGDEFAVLAEDVDSEAGACALAERLLARLREPFTLDGNDVTVSASIGIALARDVTRGEGAGEELLRNADIAMYSAKGSAKGTYAQFAHEMRSTMVERHDLQIELKHAIPKDELSLVYQPIVEIGTGTVIGIEALLRWTSPRFGAVPPGTFIPIAEETGLILEIGQWVLDHAVRDAVSLRRELDRAPAWLTINVSALQLQRPEFVDDVRAVLAEHALDPGRLVLEITESMMIRDMELAVSRLTQLRELGVMIAVDDFGTGYSSLNHIRHLPINMLKVDKSFVDRLHLDEDQTRLTATIIELARVLNLASVAEGVEHAAQLEELERLGCKFAQGYHIAHPQPLAELRALLRGGEPAELAA